MKRYAFTIMLALAGIIGISFFYGYVNETGASPEDFKIETVAGDEKEIENVSLVGALNTPNTSKSLLLSKYKAEFDTDFVLNWMYDPYSYSYSDIRKKELQQEYRSFMRGIDSVYQLYEDKYFLVHGELDVKKITDEKHQGDIRLNFFDKAQKEGKDFVVPLPEELEKYQYFYINDIQLLEQEVVIMLNAELNEKNTVWRIAVSINQEKLTSHSLIYEINATESAYMDAGNDSLAKETYMPIVITHDEEQADGTIVTEEQQFVANIESGELLEINLPDKGEYSRYEITVDGESIYYLSYEEGMLYRYNFATKTFEALWKNDAVMNENILSTVTDDRTYLLVDGADYMEGREAGDIDIYVLHTESGEELYRGRVAGDTANLDFYTIYTE